MTNCAYCGGDCKPTREHVIPAFLYSFQYQLSQSIIGWNEVVQRMVGGESKVKDVCAVCNNGTLSTLDAYGKSFLNDAGLLVQNYTRRSLTLKYEYPLLLRWFLKVSFNSSRTDGAHSPLFEEHIPFILGLCTAPPRNRIACLAYLAAPEIAGASRISHEAFANVAPGAKHFNPFVVRICYGGIPNETSYVLRIVIIGPAVFYILLFRDGISPGRAASAVRRLLKACPGALEIAPNRSFLELHVGPQSWLDLYADQVYRNRAIERGA